jgi:hypothetical protein
MLPETINLKDAQAIVSNIAGKGDFQAVEITFRFLNGNGTEKKADNGNGNGSDNASIIFPDEYINQLNTAKTVKQLFFIYYQYAKEMEHFSLDDRNRVKQALNFKKNALQKMGR